MAELGFSDITRIFRREATRTARQDWRLLSWLSAGAVLALLILNFLILDWWYGVHTRLIEAAPQVRVMDRLTISLTEDRPVRIGRDQLGQAYVRGSVAAGSAAAPEHLELTLKVADRADPTKDRVEIRNVATQRRLWLDFTDGFKTFAERFEIPRGEEADTRFALPKGASITLRRVSREGFELSTAQGGSASEKGTQTTCPAVAGPFLYRQESWWRSLWRMFTLELPAGAADRDVIAAHIGGHSTDATQRPMQICLSAALDWDQLRLVYRGDRLFLGVGRDFDRAHYPITMELLKPGTDIPLDPKRNVLGFQQISWRIAPPPPARERGIVQRIGEFFFGPGPHQPDEHVLRNFVAGRSAYSIAFQQKRDASQPGAVQRSINIVPERRIQFQSIEECVGDPLPEGCPRPIGPMEAGRDGTQCATSADKAMVQCWRTTTPVAGSGSTALMKPNPGGLIPFAVGPVAGLSELALTKWMVLLVALVLAIAFRPHGPSDRFFDGGGNGGIASRLRSSQMRWFLIATSIGLALVPEIFAVAGSLTNVGRLAHGLSPSAAMLVQTINWGLAGVALILFSPTSMFSVAIAWLAVTILAAVGSLTLFTLAIDGPSTHWLSFFLKHNYLFLSSVPPAVTAIAIASRARARRVLRAVLVERGFGLALVRISAPAILVIFFALWLFAGSQTGVAGFQPIEAGKFVTVILIAAVLVGLVGYAEDTRVQISFWERTVSFVAFATFAVFLFLAPYWRRDFSPVLIVVLLGATVGATYTAFAALNVLRAAAQRRNARMRIPLVFRPAIHRAVISRRLWWPLAWRRRLSVIGAPLVAFVTLVGLATTLYFTPVLYDWTVRALLHVDEWSTESYDRSKRIDDITAAMGKGRHVPAQRFVTWYDLDFEELKRKKTPTAEFRDLEYHVVRSRAEVAYGDCSDNKSFDPRLRWWGRWANPAIEAATSRLTDGTAAAATVRSLCRPFEFRNSKAQSETDEVEDGGRELTSNIAPIEIPVVENDFTPAFLLARYGVALGVPVYLAQVILVLVVLYGLVRIHLGGPSASPDTHLRQFLGVMLAGSITLYVLQWALSWSNVLGLLPVMGQPMTWISAGNSHHFFMALPCLLIILLALRLAGRVPLPPRRRWPPRQGRYHWQ